MSLMTLKIDAEREKNIALPDGGNVSIFPDFIGVEEQDSLYRELKNLSIWKQGEYIMHGKPVKTPRLLASMWDSEDIQSRIDPTKSGGNVTWTKENDWIKKGIVWTPHMALLKEKIEDYLDVKLDYAQLNLYRNGTDYIGWHCDDEVPDGSLIVSISLGASRDFILRHKSTFPTLAVCKNTPMDERIYTKYQIKTKPGMLLIMDQDAGKNKWKHTLPKRPDLKKDRINITFRQSFLKNDRNYKIGENGYVELNFVG